MPNADGSAATTNVLDANRCVAWLGRNQPQISQDLDLPPYDPSVCPDGSTDTSLCDPAGTASAAVTKQRRGKRGSGGSAPEAGSGGSAPAGSGGAGGSDSGSGDAPSPPGPPVAPAPPGGSGGDGLLPGLDDLLGRRAGKQRSAAAPATSSGNRDLLGYLFGN